jgi:hypothetical protein
MLEAMKPLPVPGLPLQIDGNLSNKSIDQAKPDINRMKINHAELMLPQTESACQ